MKKLSNLEVHFENDSVATVPADLLGIIYFGGRNNSYWGIPNKSNYATILIDRDAKNVPGSDFTQEFLSGELDSDGLMPCNRIESFKLIYDNGSQEEIEPVLYRNTAYELTPAEKSGRSCTIAKFSQKTNPYQEIRVNKHGDVFIHIDAQHGFAATVHQYSTPNSDTKDRLYGWYKESDSDDYVVPCKHRGLTRQHPDDDGSVQDDGFPKSTCTIVFHNGSEIEVPIKYVSLHYGQHDMHEFNFQNNDTFYRKTDCKRVIVDIDRDASKAVGSDFETAFLHNKPDADGLIQCNSIHSIWLSDETGAYEIINPPQYRLYRHYGDDAEQRKAWGNASNLYQSVFINQHGDIHIEIDAKGSYFIGSNRHERFLTDGFKPI
ncbi:MAG: hypothetical protein FWE28_00660 [Oscillospiraceae bacterium]|nr:hypothetical protein [Oscillospiraceae bacterium]